MNRKEKKIIKRRNWWLVAFRVFLIVAFIIWFILAFCIDLLVWVFTLGRINLFKHGAINRHTKKPVYPELGEKGNMKPLNHTVKKSDVQPPPAPKPLKDNNINQ